MKESYHPICSFFKAFVNYLILSIASWLMSESNLIKMQFIKCGSIWKKNPSVEVFAAIWGYSFKILMMSLATVMMGMTKMK